MTDELNGPAGLREAYDRSQERNKVLEAKLSTQALIDAGFSDPDSVESKAVEKFFDGDFTDSDAIAKFAKETLGYDLDAPSKEISAEPATPHVNPADVVVADIRSDELDATAADDAIVSRSETETLVNDLMKVAVAHGAGNAEQIEAAMAAELQGHGYMPDRTYAGAPLTQ